MATRVSKRVKRPTPRSVPTSSVVPLTTDDGMTWLDPSGRPPRINVQGKLAEPFLLRLTYSDGTLRGTERWAAGLELPLTPKAHELWAAQVIAERERKHPTQAVPATAARTAVTAEGKRRRLRDDELSPEQLAKRRKNQANNLKRKRRLES